MNKHKEKCFELERKHQEEREIWLAKEKKYNQELSEERAQRIKSDEDYNTMYKENINLRNNLELEKSHHGFKLKEKSLIASQAQGEH